MPEEEKIDEDLVRLQEELEKLESKEGGSSSLPTSSKYDMSKFFRDAGNRKDTTRVSKLTKQQIGELANSEIGLRSIGLYAKAEGLTTVSDYLNEKANLIPELYMSKDGFFLQSAVTQIKKTSGVKPAIKKKWFGGGNKEWGE